MIRRGEGHGERGQTIILVAISIVALLAMAALAIDVVTLYVASSEIKRAADAVALAAAKAIADSGVTTLCATTAPPCTGPDPQFPAAKDLAVGMVGTATTGAIGAVLPANTVAGATPTVSVDWSQAWTNQGNPIIKVSLQRTGLPTFFSKIWGRTGSTVSASSTAEVYNPSNNPSPTPITPTSVKPWLVANTVPGTNGKQFVDMTTGLVLTPIIGTQFGFDLTADCYGFGFNCRHDNPPIAPTVYQVEYMPAAVTSNAGQNVCPSSCSGSGFEMSIACADVTTAYSCGAGGATVAPNYSPGGAGGDTAAGTECLIHAASNGIAQGQDQLTFSFPSSPPQITAESGPYAGSFVSVSSSIVTIPIIDNRTPVTTSVNVVGFLQAFINGIEPGVNPSDGTWGDVNITVLNVAGCSLGTNGNPPVVGGRGTSPVAVRLIASP